ncbi:hypothethical protein (plasmid) [Ralstonia solanacearum CMR15]|uniref:Hypothethical protein n=1 Tax=Ralstonia solanacearum TaxID=305 RepID=A0A0S4VFE5_RALSL|nr:hypothethical protein [Ralstonia solanacearum CMR15]CUV33331.1 Hypothethical protein [Ralstonia solanacearum]CUV40611.1 Hypothethical protein [Ralstonia solanacearum]CUV62374.1 Hypothethical protein [Ralstonia solanacearum]
MATSTGQTPEWAILHQYRGN